MILNIGNFWTSGGGTACSYTGEGDLVLTGLTPKAWGGLRAFSSLTCGQKAVNVCWPNGAGPEQCTDFLTSATTGNLVVTAISGHNCTSAGECTIKTFYDQTGLLGCSGPCDWTQATVANRYSFLPAGSAAGLCPAATSFLALPAAGGASPNQQNAWSTFICAAVAHGYWARLDVLQLYAADTQAHALLNLVSPYGFNGALVSGGASCGFTIGAGFNCLGVPFGVYSYINTNFTPISGTQFTQNVGSIGVGIIETGGGGSLYSGTAAIGSDTGLLQVQTDLYPNFSGSSYFRVNEGTGFNAANASNTTGLWTAIRTNSTTVYGYRGAGSLGSATSAAAAVVSGNLILGANNSGTPGAGYDGTYQVFYAGALLTTDIPNLRTDVNAYLATIYGSAPY
jgi:hypothetical protein